MKNGTKVGNISTINNKNLWISFINIFKLDYVDMVK